MTDFDKRQGQIVAMGGGGFSMEPDNPLLDEYVLSLSGAQSPNILFLATASGDDRGYIDRFYTAFARFPCVPSHLSLFQLSTADLRALVLA